MRAFAIFMGLIGLGLLGIAALAYPAWLLLTPQFDFPFHRVASRIAMLTLAVAFFFTVRRMRLANRSSMGYGLPRRAFLRELGVGLVLGVVMMLPIVALMLALDMRTLRSNVTLDLATFATLTFKGLTSGLVVALIEETFLRGAMHTAIARESGARTAIVLTALVYSATHFIGKYRIPADEVHAGSGLDMLAGVLHSFAQPLAIADAFLALAAVGILLGLVRSLTGNIAACIGLHAGWVWAITFIRATSAPDESSPYAFLLSRFDGFVGWLVLGWTLVMGAVLYRYYSRRSTAGVGVTPARRAA
ncbi:MAG TPA: CPBP family intramembrane metalloprotease [Steroidobacteraceae bacterium]|nr:CPBP family intramembrane metalloprotease [Steroidobacteraceae bacterium]HRX88657.1 CPBP family intramembrane metalloprotease [Steroidobacteraceae bacterium]